MFKINFLFRDVLGFSFFFFFFFFTCDSFIQMMYSPEGPLKEPFSPGLLTWGPSIRTGRKAVYLFTVVSNWNLPCPSIVNVRSNWNVAFPSISNVILLAVFDTVTSKNRSQLPTHYVDWEDIWIGKIFQNVFYTYRCFKIKNIRVIFRADARSGHWMV